MKGTRYRIWQQRSKKPYSLSEERAEWLGFHTELDIYRVPVNGHLDFTSKEIDTYLLRGWSKVEWGWGTWIEGTAAEFVIALPSAKKDWILTFELIAFEPASAKETQSVELIVNGFSAGIQELDRRKKLQEVSFEIPPLWVKARLDRLRVKLQYAHSPAELGLSADSRKLSVALRKIHFKLRDH